jgi:hypothetical protein
MHTEFTDTAFSTDARLVPPESALDQIVSTSDDGMADDGAIWIPMPPVQTPIWPRVWPGL